MRESNFLAGNATIKQDQKNVFINTKRQYMKESNTLAGNVTIKQVERRALHDTKGQYMI